MGTPALTIVKDDEGKKDLVTIYRQCDGYLDGHGKDLKEFLLKRVLTDGYTPGGRGEIIESNGMGCLAAQLISDLKTKGGTRGSDTPGRIYVHPNGSKAQPWEYFYVISAIPQKWKNPGDFNLKVYYGTKALYNGPVKDFDPMMEGTE